MSLGRQRHALRESRRLFVDSGHVRRRQAAVSKGGGRRGRLRRVQNVTLLSAMEPSPWLITRAGLAEPWRINPMSHPAPIIPTFWQYRSHASRLGDACRNGARFRVAAFSVARKPYSKSEQCRSLFSFIPYGTRGSRNHVLLTARRVLFGAAFYYKSYPICKFPSIPSSQTYLHV